MEGAVDSRTSDLKGHVKRTSGSSRVIVHVKSYAWMYLMALPGILYFVTFKYWPMLGVRIAFQNYSPFLGFGRSPWVGWKHFEELFAGPDFARILGNTLVLAMLSFLFVFPAPILLALLLNEIRMSWLRRSIQTIVYLPHFLSWTLVVSLWMLLFGVAGPMAGLTVDLLGTRIDFLGDPTWFRPMIVLQLLWKNAGWGSIIYLAALAGVDANLYEAARVDGAGRWRQTWHVTLPAIRSTIVVMAILNCGSILETGFEQIYLMTNSLNRPVAEVFDTYVYHMGLTQGAYSYSTAVGLFKAVVGVVLIFGANRLAKRFGQRGIF